MNNCIKIFILILIIIFSVGCAKQALPEKDDEGTKEYFNEKIVIAFRGNVRPTTDGELALRNYFPNVDFEYLCTGVNKWPDKLNIMLAAGKIPDVIVCDDVEIVQDYIAQGFLCRVSKKEIKQYAPMVYSAIEEGKENLWLCTANNGENWGVPIPGKNLLTSKILVFNSEWLERLGESTPPVTIDEMEKLFKRMVTEDPDGNGKNDTYALCPAGRADALETASAVFGAYGVFPDMWMKQADNTLQFGMTTKEAKSALRRLQKWYAQGLIDPEFISTDLQVEEYKWKKGKIGTMAANALLVYNLNGGDKRAVLSKAPIGAAGRFGYKKNGNVSSVLVFGKQLSQVTTKLDRILGMVDKIVSDKVLSERLSFLNYEHNKNGNASGTGSGRGLGTVLLPLPSVSKEIFKDTAIANFDGFFEEGNLENGHDYFPYGAYATSSDLKIIAKVAYEFAQHSMIEFIIGERDIEDFDTFVAEWKKKGGEQMTRSANDYANNTGIVKGQ